MSIKPSFTCRTEACQRLSCSSMLVRSLSSLCFISSELSVRSVKVRPGPAPIPGLESLKSMDPRLRGGDSEVVAKAAGLLLLEEPGIQDARHKRAHNRRYPERPKLAQRPAAHEEGRPGASRGVDRKIVHRNADQMDQRQAQPDGDAREPLGRARVGCAQNDEEEKEGEHNLGHQARPERVPTR